MLRYLRSLADKDLALDRTMIPLGSCTMKLNATSEMIPVTWPEFAQHPPVRAGRADRRLPRTDRPAAKTCCARPPATPRVSLQPNAGSQGEYAGLLVIQRYHAVARRRPPQHLPDPVVGARHQPGHRARWSACRWW